MTEEFLALHLQLFQLYKIISKPTVSQGTVLSVQGGLEADPLVRWWRSKFT